jgi:hypothetical protein
VVVIPKCDWVAVLGRGVRGGWAESGFIRKELSIPKGEDSESCAASRNEEDGKNSASTERGKDIEDMAACKTRTARGDGW